MTRKIDIARNGSAAFGVRNGGNAGSKRNLFSSQVTPYGDPKAPIPLGDVLRNDWFELWYQPKIELKTLHLVGAEALVRARHPSRGILPPDLFLPGASEKMFAEYGVSIKLAVNVPVSALTDLPIPQMLRETRPRAANWLVLTLEVPMHCVS